MKKKLIIAAAIGAIAAAAVPAMALENEFHGMYKFMGYQTNFFEGTTMSPAQVNGTLKKDAHSGFMAEQRARINYIAKANDNLKLVTHFELDSRFGGLGTTGYKGTATGNDGGQLDADSLTLETKSIYLDVNCPITGANFKVGMQPWVDSYQSLFLLADMTGAIASKGFGPATASLGWFRFNDQDAAGAGTPGRKSADLIVLDGKFAINKDLKVGASYYNVQNDSGTAVPAADLLHLLGLNADLTFGPANVKPFFAYEFGELQKATDNKISAFLVGAVTKTKVGPGAINLSAIYLSGDDQAATVDQKKSFKAVSANTSYFNAANMWLLVRSGQAVNSSTSVLGNDNTAGGRGLFGVFAGYEGTMDKLFYNANVGYAQAAKAKAGTAEKKTIGTELNAQVGYKLYDNLSVSAAVAYAILGDGLNSKVNAERFGGSADADNPYMVNIQLSYVF